MGDTVAATLSGLAQSRGVSLAGLSRMLGRNVAYLHQFVTRGTPRRLDERDRRVLAQFFGVGEELLGAEAATGDVVDVPYLALAAAAGPGAAVGEEAILRVERLSRAMLDEAGVSRAAASLIDVRGDSMAPGIMAGDRLLVDRADRRVPRGGAVFVIRRDDDLSVKRLLPAGAGLRIVSDNPAYAPAAIDPPDVAVIGRVKLLLRVP